MRFKDRTGETRIMNNGLEAKIIRYGGINDIDIEFIESGIILKNKNYNNFKAGKVAIDGRKQQTGIKVYGFGLCDELSAQNGKQFKSYKFWIHMLERCYDEKLHEKHPSYKDCRVCEEWKYYSIFKKWYEDNYYEVKGERMALDKDILIKGNKIYSPKTCIFVPQSINSMFTKKDKKIRKRDKNLPIGITLKDNGRYMVNVIIDDKKTTRRADTIDEAFDIFKYYREKYIKSIADKYKDQIPQKLYDAMYKWEIDIND